MLTLKALFNYHKIVNFLAKNKYLFYMSGGITAGTITILLITKSLPINHNQHLAYKNTLQKREEIWIKINQNALKLKYDDFNSIAKLLDLLNQLDENQQKLEQTPDFFAYIESQEYDYELKKNKKQIQVLNEILKNFQAEKFDFARLEKVLDSNQINNLDDLYDFQHQKIVERINFYRLSAYIWSLFILIAISYQIISNLSKTNRQIIKTLEGFTEELETKVEQRTAQLEESFRETKAALAQAQAADRAKSRFLANMSHELRTPLNAILGFTQLMSRDQSVPPEHQEVVGIVNRSGEHLLKLINDILEMSKIEVGQTQLNENTFDLCLMLKSLEEMLSLKAEAKNLQLIFNQEQNVPQYIKADEGKVRQILINLLGNALKFTREGSVTLNIKLKEPLNLVANQVDFFLDDSCWLNFEIVDTGPGIEAAEMERLFSPFEQTKVGIESQEGTGLGLSISKKFIELMGGKLSVSSVVGKGTVFAFDILVRSVNTSEAINGDRHQAHQIITGLAPEQENFRILAVDDVAQSRLLLRKMLTSVGFEVAEASNGQEAIAVWESWQPHLILMDMRMPVMDGYEATKSIKSQPSGQKTVIIALTASAFEEERIVILSAGCDDFMRKPFYEAELFDKIAQHLGVNYVYEDNSDRTRSSLVVTEANLFSQLTPESLTIMPTQWRTDLHQAASQVDNQEIFKLLEEIPAEHESIARDLRTLVEQFRCDKIIDLTESVKQ